MQRSSMRSLDFYPSVSATCGARSSVIVPKATDLILAVRAPVRHTGTSIRAASRDRAASARTHLHARRLAGARERKKGEDEPIAFHQAMLLWIGATILSHLRSR